jgi:pyruvate dehydrogenase E2 component (dihydrolipoamide acetyltransferase)
VATVDLTVPDLGDFADIPIIEVLVKPGDRIEKDAPLITLESEKATMEVPADAAGVIDEVRVHVGDRVSKGTVLATLASSTESPAATTPSPTATPVTAAPAAPAPVAAPVALPAPAAAGPAPEPRSVAAAPTIVVHASPAIRRFARELGVDLARVSGSGPNRRVTREDIQGFVKRTLTASPPTDGALQGSALGLAPWPKVDFAQFGPIERAPLSRIKKLSGSNLHRNWVMIPHVTQHDDADITELEAFRSELNREQKDVKVTLLAFLMKAAVAALRRYPDFNASLDGDDLVRKGYYHIGFAADTPGGLVVPVVRDVDRKGVLEVAGETAELAAKAREGKLGIREMQGGTFTISSLGGIGGTYFSPIVNAPELAILGVCRAATRPVWDGNTFVPRLMLPLSLSYDHRVIDGAAAARFTVFLASVLADMRRTLL